MVYEYKATVHKIVDGDTVYMNVDLGFKISVVLDFRLVGINTPEMVGETRTAGIAAKNELERLLGLGKIKVITSKSDKYGRWLAQVFVEQSNGQVINVNSSLIDGGFATPYNP